MEFREVIEFKGRFLRVMSTDAGSIVIFDIIRFIACDTLLAVGKDDVDGVGRISGFIGKLGARFNNVLERLGVTLIALEGGERLLFSNDFEFDLLTVS